MRASYAMGDDTLDGRRAVAAPVAAGYPARWPPRPRNGAAGPSVAGSGFERLRAPQRPHLGTGAAALAA